MRYRFADVFAEVRRAPKSIAEQIAAIPGVAAAEPRITHLALLDVEGLRRAGDRPGRLDPDLRRAAAQPACICARAGCRSASGPTRSTVNEAFAKAHRHAARARRFKALLNGKKRELKVVGIALSPEFIYALGPGDLMPDDRRFAVLWMSEKALAGALRSRRRLQRGHA